ncbi:MAG: alpha-L-glutamate ligase-like protein [Halorhodospira halophila]|uniref:alpha-L-glutamate ligase-like protein n=1 Tax=Halorhodospira TaxID=85108 RepID=UPI00191373B5|nr:MULTISPECIES: alpha-L-glutamate ligase-like protein [Halorhodospira]MBK5935826.1 alpha-L-glutamate ligase-like protein [Halorhodospira halophila]MBK5944580.1 alpha-L-glutamate ligase-like protein [Halorhodospira halophila]MCC3751384.1 alpha-L-glutamate ligase-like protein [Halorhodospira halophila]MCG5527275.1 alpha-L-glutamate ligase-like protein [Halorhodospira halophila]MCG5532498.1 alpha-L-glutamate ligase-like protein [Halorhodospira sp. 9621]
MILRHWRTARRLRQAGILGMNRRNVHYIGQYNDRRLYPLVDDKLRTKLLAEEHGVGTPSLRFTIRHQHEVRDLAGRLQGVDEFVIKPAKGAGGKGILVVTGRRGDRFLTGGERELSLEDLQRHVSNTLAGLHSLAGMPDTAVFEDRIRLDPRFEALSYEGIPDIRVLVFLGYPVMAMLRLSTKDSQGKANLHQGAVGVGLDIATGRCAHAVQYDQRVYQHPDTGVTLDDIDIPDWRSLLELAARCQEMSGLGYLGADLVLDRDRGPQLLELNARPGLSVQIANGCGLLPRLGAIEALESRHATAEARVGWAMEQFAVGT